MTHDLQVTCVVSDGSDDDSRIDAIGGGSTILTRWEHTIDNAIRYIECNTFKYHTLTSGKFARIIVRKHSVSGRKYLTTEADGYACNNLSNLQSCRIAA